MNRVNIKKLYALALITASCVSPVYPTHTVSRYYPFIERPEDFVIKNRSHITPTFFIVDTSTASRRGGGTAGVPELWGRYDLKDVLASLHAVNPTLNPIFEITGNNDLAGKSMRFKVNGPSSGAGFLLNYEQDLRWYGFQCGASIPFMFIQTSGRYSFDRENSDPLFHMDTLESQYGSDQNKADLQAQQQELIVDAIRRYTHDLIELYNNVDTQTGFGDLDVHVRWNHIFDHILLTKSIDINFQCGVIIPTSENTNINTASSLPFGANGHWGMYGDFITEIELKQDWTAGFMIGIAHLFPHSYTFRIPIEHEPAIFSALSGRIHAHPGDTIKVSPYFTLGNLTDGLHFQARYTYLHHNVDTWDDARSNKTVNGHVVPSYLDKGGGLISEKETLSKWRSNYITLQLIYDTKAAMKNYKLKPTLFVGYDIPINGNGSANTHQLMLGVELHF